jgi:hypothetical protein
MQEYVFKILVEVIKSAVYYEFYNMNKYYISKITKNIKCIKILKNIKTVL